MNFNLTKMISSKEARLSTDMARDCQGFHTREDGKEMIHFGNVKQEEAAGLNTLVMGLE